MGSVDPEMQKLVSSKKRELKKANTSYSELNETEQMIVKHYLLDDNRSLVRAVINAGVADDLDEASQIATALAESGRIAQAIEDVQKLDGITPGRIKERLWKMFSNIGDGGEDTGEYQPREQIAAGKLLVSMMDLPKDDGGSRTKELDEQQFRANRSRIASGVNGALSRIKGRVPPKS